MAHALCELDARRVDLTLLSSPQDWAAPGLRAEWERLVEQGGNLRSLFQSPAWFDHLHATRPHQRRTLVTIRDEDGVLVGVVPLAATEVVLEYNVSRVRLGRSRLPAMELLGDRPLVPEVDGIHDQLFQVLHREFCQDAALQVNLLPTSSYCWRHLVASPLIRDAFVLHVGDGLSRNHAIALGGTFDDYLAGFRSEKRYKFRRKVRRLREQGGGSLALCRFEAPAEVGPFLERAARVAQRSWQSSCCDDQVADNDFWRRKLTDLAERGIFRAYVLEAGGSGCAFVLGYQGYGGYHHVQTGYDPAFQRFAPGTVLLYLLIEDLTRHRPPERLSFGFGDSLYKQEIGNVTSEEASFLLLRKSCANVLRSRTHSAFRYMVRVARRFRSIHD
jgi:CelD/BcsL family acetyltransferase involved in cellulose biosynthesis